MKDYYLGIEEWRKIDSAPNYEVSNLGRVRSTHRSVCTNGYQPNDVAILKPICRGKTGYYCVHIHINGKKKMVDIHRLVALAFIENERPKDFNMVNHIDGDKTNNRVDNLEWCNCSMNMLHAYKHGLQKNGNIRPVIQTYSNGDYLCAFKSIAEAAIVNGVTLAHAWQCVKKNKLFRRKYYLKYL
jgi:hypothetical protein